MKNENQLSASEAIYLFAGWLTSRSERTVMSATDNAAPAAVLVNHFIQKQGLELPREEWNKIAEITDMSKHDIQVGKTLECLTREDAEAALFIHIGGKPKGYKYHALTGTELAFGYINGKDMFNIKKVNILDLGFKACQYLQSQSYIF